MNKHQKSIVGFDLDMTLVDSAEAILRSAQATLTKFGAASQVTQSEIKNRIGLPMKDSLNYWLGDKSTEMAFEFYKEYYVKYALSYSEAMPGAVNLLNKFSSQFVEFCVITAKDALVAEAQLKFLNFPKTKIYGNRFRSEKTVAMLDFGCNIYVGDHFEDYEAAKRANIDFIGVDFNKNHDLRGLIPSNIPILSTLDSMADHVLK